MNSIQIGNYSTDKKTVAKSVSKSEEVMWDRNMFTKDVILYISIKQFFTPKKNSR